MLIRKAILEKIKSGDVTLAFRRWRRTTVKTGGSLKTEVGILAIQNVEKITLQCISDFDAQQAGYSAKGALVKDLGNRDGDLFKITLAYVGADPRIELRENDNLSEEEFTKLIQQLQRLDSASKKGDWTRRILMAIREYPMTPAVQLANETGFEKDWLKTNVRKLKNLGLTISHQPGYTLSPRGRAVVEQLHKNAE